MIWIHMPTIFRNFSNHLVLIGATLIGHSTGGGEVARYIGRHGTSRVIKLVLMGSVTPFMVKTSSNPGGAASQV